MADDDEFSFDPEDDEDEFDTDSDSEDDDDEFDDDELDEEARLAEAREIAKLRWEIDGLKQVHGTLREHYRSEMRALIEPLVDKHRQLKEENQQLQVSLAAAIQARHDADSGIKQEIADLKAAHAALVSRSDELEVSSRESRRLQAELSDADAKIAGLEGEIAELERDCRRHEAILAEKDRELDTLRKTIADTEARGQEWQQRYEQAKTDHADDLAMYQEQIRETAEQTGILEMRAQEFTQMDHLLPELYSSLRAEKKTIDGIEALLFPQVPEPEPVLAAVGARTEEATSEEAPDDWETAQPAADGFADGAEWADAATGEHETFDRDAAEPADLTAIAPSGMALAASELDDGLPSDAALPILESDLEMATAAWDVPLGEGETAWQPTGEEPAYTEIAQDLSWPAETTDETFPLPETGLSEGAETWQTESDFGAVGIRADDEVTTFDHVPSADWGRGALTDDVETGLSAQDDLLAFGQPEEAGVDTDASWQMDGDATAPVGGPGLAIPDLDGPAVGAVAIPGFDDPHDDPV